MLIASPSIHTSQSLLNADEWFERTILTIYMEGTPRVLIRSKESYFR